MNNRENQTLLLLLLLLCAAVLCSCGCVQQAPVHAFTMEDNGNSFLIGMDDNVSVTLASNPTTGYEWIADTTGNLVITDQEFFPDNVPGMVGVGGNQRWTLSANAPGTYEFNAVYRRSWEEPGQDEMFHLTLIYR